MENNNNKELLLINWFNDNFPPINLNDKYLDVIELIDRYTNLKEENEKLRERVKYLENLISEYTCKMLQVLNTDIDKTGAPINPLINT